MTHKKNWMLGSYIEEQFTNVISFMESGQAKEVNFHNVMTVLKPPQM